MALLVHDKQMMDDVKRGIVSTEELTNYLIRTYPVTQLARELAEIMLNENQLGTKPVVITEAQFKAFFRVQGYKWVNGRLEVETRGAKRKDENL